MTIEEATKKKVELEKILLASITLYEEITHCFVSVIRLKFVTTDQGTKHTQGIKITVELPED